MVLKSSIFLLIALSCNAQNVVVTTDTNLSQPSLVYSLDSFTTNTFIIKYKKNKKNDVENKVKNSHPQHKIKSLNNIGMSMLETHGNSKGVIDDLTTNGLVDFIQQAHVVTVQDTIPNDIQWSNQWDMSKIQMSKAWDLTHGNSNFIVAVVDTGCDWTHPDLTNQIYQDSVTGFHGWVCTNGFLTNSSWSGFDDYGHGTHCAGTIGATVNNIIGMAGMNWNIKILPMKFLTSTGGGLDSDAIILFDELITLKKSGLNIVCDSNSWGGPGDDPAVDAAIQALEDNGIVTVIAAGNSALNIDINPVDPAVAPVRSKITVIASDTSDNTASFSNYGFVNADIGAPGVLTLSTMVTNPSVSLHNTNGYGLLSGTSMATPHVAGLVALLKAMNTNLTVQQLHDIILNTNSYDKMNDLHGSLTTTGGRINAYRTITNLLINFPRTNKYPVITSSTASNLGHVVASNTASLSFTATDGDGDPLTYLMFSSDLSVPYTFTNALTYTAPSFAFNTALTINQEVSDRNGGAVNQKSYINIYTNPALFIDTYAIGLNIIQTPAPPNLNFEYDTWYVTNSTPTDTVVSGILIVEFKGQFNSFHVSLIGTNEIFVLLPPSLTNDSACHFMFFRNQQDTIVRTPKIITNFVPGGYTNYPELVVKLDKTVGTVPFIVNYDFSQSSVTNGAAFFVLSPTTLFAPPAPITGQIEIDTPGLYQFQFQMRDTNSYPDVKYVYISALAPETAPTNRIAQVQKLHVKKAQTK